MTCWSCHEKVQGPVCAGCGAIQPPSPDLDLFAMLGLPRRYHLGERELEKAWRQLSRKVHPDRFAGKRAVERRMSLQWTASINEARRVLKDPMKRATYLATGQAEPREAGGPQLDPEFMEKVFELQFEAKVDPDSVRAEVIALRAQVQEELEALFSRWEDEGGELTGAEDLISRLRYLGTAARLVDADGESAPSL